MREQLATIVDAARAEAFVGRSAELAAFEAALRGDRSSRVLFVHGPGGQGKSALLNRFKAHARQAGVDVVSLDGQDVDCTAEGMQAAVGSTPTLTAERTDGADGADAETDAGPEERPTWVLLIDGYERLAAMDDWIRDSLIAQLPPEAVVVIAGREPPSLVWRTDPGWRAVVASLPLEALDPTESEQLLVRAGVSEERRAAYVDIGRGHPLTLAMLADAAETGEIPTELAGAPDVVAALMARLVDQAPDQDHALAMALCAHTWLTTQDLVDELLERSSPEVWAWLEGRPWVTRGTYGIYPHDLVRDVLDADLRRRSPATYRRVHECVHDHSWRALRSPDEVERRLWAHQKLFLHRNSPLASSFWTMRTQGSGVVVPGRAEDHEEVLSLIERYEGPDSAALAARWFAEQPENLSVVKTPTRLEAMVFNAISPADPALLDDDPVLSTVIDFVARTAPARPGEQISVGRFLAGRAHHQRDPYAVVCGSVASTMLWTTSPLAWSFVAVSDPEFWGPAFHYLALTTELRTTSAGLDITLYGVDWRRLSPERWFELLGERELSGQAGPAPAQLLRPPPLTREQFTEALRQALRDLNQPDLLDTNALMGSRLALGSHGEPVDVLRTSLVSAIDQIRGEPRGESLGRLLDRTYVHAAPSQEAAAAVLDLPFSTYRRHLSRAVERLNDLLWAVEIGAVRLERGQKVSTGRSGE